MGWWQEEDESYKDFKVVVKCTVLCVSLFVGLFLSILQVIMREREPSLLGTLKEIWDFCNKIYLDVRTERYQIFLILINLCTVPSRYTRNFSLCFCVLLCVEKVCFKFQTVLGVWYTLQTYINIHPWFLPVPLSSTRQQRQRTPVGKNISWSQWCEASFTRWAHAFFLLREDWGVGFFLFPICSHEIFNLFSWNLQVFNMFLKFPMCSPTCSQ